MENLHQEFKFESASGVEYLLRVTSIGFVLFDAKTQEQLVDASVLVSRDGLLPYWPVEIVASSTNREFYFSHTPKNGEKMAHAIEFGIRRRE